MAGSLGKLEEKDAHVIINPFLQRVVLILPHERSIQHACSPCGFGFQLPASCLVPARRSKVLILLIWETFFIEKIETKTPLIDPEYLDIHDSIHCKSQVVKGHPPLKQVNASMPSRLWRPSTLLQHDHDRHRTQYTA